MVELTLEQKRAIAVASARKRAAEAEGGPQSYIDMAKTALRYGTPTGLAQNLGENIAQDIMVRPEQTDSRDSAMGKVDAVMRGAADTLSFGLADEAAAAADAGLNPVLGTGNDGDSFSNRYSKNLAVQRGIDDSDYENRFQQRLSGQLAGGITGGLGLAKNGLSLTENAIRAGKSLPKVMLAGGAEGTAFGAAQGFGSGEGTADRLNKALLGGVAGGTIGAAAPPIISGVGKVAGAIGALLRPQDGADKALATALRRSGKSLDDIIGEMDAARADGQDMFNTADAMGHAGQRQLSSVTRVPNDARQQVVESLRGRQMDQGRRIASHLSDASGSNLTAEQYQQLLRQERATAAATNYRPVMEDTSQINVTPVVRAANRVISPTADARAAARGDLPTDIAARRTIESAEASIRDPIREAAKEARSYLASDNLTVTNVEKAFRAKTNIDQMINKATQNNQGATVDALMPIRDSLDEALAATSPQYAAARDAYRTASHPIEAVDIGRQMAAGRTRVDDNLSTFGALPDEASQKAARVGYFNPKIAAAQNRAGSFSDSSRPLNSDAMRTELPAFSAPGRGDQLMARIGRERTMFDTTSEALGGSRTADNLADQADMQSFDPEIVSNLMQGNVGGSIMTALRKGLNYAAGMPPKVTERVARTLIETNPEVVRAVIGGGLEKLSAADQARAKIVAALINSGSSVPGRLSP